MKSAKKERILQAAIRAAIAQSDYRVNRDDVARRARVAPGLVNHYFGAVVNIHDELVKFAIRNSLHKVVAMALLANHPATKDLKPAERQKALAHILK